LTSPPNTAKQPTDASPAKKLFVLGEYDRAFQEFFRDAVSAVGRSQDPILAQMRVERHEQVPTSRIPITAEEAVEIPPMEVQLEISFPATVLIEGDVEGLLAVIADVADQHVRSFMPQLFEAIDRITDATGNKIVAAGRPFSPELLLEALETIEWSFDDDGEPVMPTLVMSPEMAESVSRLPPLTVEQEQAFADLKERKRAEYLASRRHRKLS
jgi:hypothetical protein